MSILRGALNGLIPPVERLPRNFGPSGIVFVDSHNHQLDMVFNADVLLPSPTSLQLASLVLALNTTALLQARPSGIPRSLSALR